MRNEWILYVLRCSDGTLYTGITLDLERRVQEHNTSRRGAKYTRPVVLVYSEGHPDRSTALKAEYKFKQLKRATKEEIINESR